MTSRALYRVVLASPRWTLNGVNIFNLNLARGLEARGQDVRILLTEETTELVAATDSPMTRPEDLRFDELDVEPWSGWGAHWGTTIRYLTSEVPTVYVPNYDYRHSCVSPRLPSGVSVVGVVHSDDPLHYEHVARLGESWDATVCVSSTLGRRTAELCPAIADRVETIPIGITIPESFPERSEEGEEPLKIIYHGVLKQHQKRVLDLPRIIAALERRGVPVHLTVAGGGPEEEALRSASAEQIERGTMEFLGVVPHERIPQLLRANDVYLLVSEFEGMPNALLEAMANGCVPVVSDMESGIPELVRPGESGELVEIGDIEAFAERLATLQRDPARRHRIAHTAYREVSGGAFSVDDMIEAYLTVFDRVVADAETGRFVRVSGEILPPPAAVEGVGVFEAGEGSPAAEHVVHQPGLGTFPSRQDLRDFERALSPTAPPAANRFRLVATIPFLTDTWSTARALELLTGLARAGAEVRVLLTEERTDHVEVSGTPIPAPEGIELAHLAVGRSEGWGGHWGATVRALRSSAPCIYLPLHDWRHACVSPFLPEDVRIVGSISDDPLYLEQAERLGAAWDAAVAVDEPAYRALERRAPGLAPRTWVIPPGVEGESYDIDAMTGRYLSLFDDLDRANPVRLRSTAIQPPPPEVEGVGVFPVELTVEIDGVGRFPSAKDHRRFQGQLGSLQPLRSVLDRLRD